MFTQPPNPMTSKELIDFICPEHGRTSCSDSNLFNGFYMNDEDDVIMPIIPRCSRCSLLMIENGCVPIIKENKELMGVSIYINKRK